MFFVFYLEIGGAKKPTGDGSDGVYETEEASATITEDRSRTSAAVGVPAESVGQANEVGNKKALQIIQRIRDKLAGKIFHQEIIFF